VPTAHAQYATRPWGSVSVVSPMNMSGVLASCSRRPVDFQILLRARHATCTEPATFDQFMCEAQCPVEEPELERTIGVLGLANHSYSWPIEHCVQGRALYLVWILQGEINFVACAADRPYASRTYSTVRTVFVTTLRVLHLLSCLVRLPDVVFLLDPSDFATPTAPSQVSEWSYMEPLPPTFRYVGTRAHAGILFPTDSFLVNSAFCSLRRKDASTFAVCAKQSSNVPWEQRSDKIVWRGLPTGTPWTNTTWRHTQRMALVRSFGKVGHLFDVGRLPCFLPVEALTSFLYVGAGFTQPATSWIRDLPNVELREMADAWTVASEVDRAAHAHYKYLLHVDGHGASWGLIHKLMSGSVTLLVESSRDYREHYYVHLRPMHHYIPVRPDMRDLESIAAWLQTTKGIRQAKLIAQRAKTLVHSRFRAQDALCYIARAIESVARLQTTKATHEAVLEKLRHLRKTVRVFDVHNPTFDILLREWLAKKPIM